MYFLNVETFGVSKLIKYSYFSFLHNYLSIPILQPKPKKNTVTDFTGMTSMKSCSFPQGISLIVTDHWSSFVVDVYLTGIQLPCNTEFL